MEDNKIHLNGKLIKCGINVIKYYLTTEKMHETY